MDLKNKKILIIGMARSGLAVANALKNKKNYIIMNDLKTKEQLKDLVNENSHIDQFVLGKHFTNLDIIDLIVISPGVPLNIEPIKKAKRLGIEVIGELELAYRLVKGKFIGITGTNGKTTTTALTSEIYEKSNDDTFCVGNIGKPAISIFKKTNQSTNIITEVSSFQLETIKKFHPKISAILNITPDHLNRHITMENYIEAKKRIFKNQNSNDYIILNYDNLITRKIGKEIKDIKTIYFSMKEEVKQGIFFKDNCIYINDNKEKIKIINVDDLNILGKHNIENAMAAVAISYYDGISIDIIRKVLKEFKAVEHRIEFVKELNNIKFYNDSKATNPEAAIKGINSMKGPTILIAGGMDKKSEFDEFIKNVKNNIKFLILFGETKYKIEKVAKEYNYDKVEIVDNLKQAVKLAYKLAKNNQNILLSPACASWDMYKSYEHRGNEFKKIVDSLGD
ncbi:MAG: UDP-N-acetylmuramoyl-L-alanine--D-glutamate ligase [Bacillota bacterium]